jgi:predicted TIM-barrel fold metal-dependent hydrolase
MVFGTDFPHLDHDHGIVDAMLAQRPMLGDAALRAILWDSPCELMRVDSSAGQIA